MTVELDPEAAEALAKLTSKAQIRRDEMLENLIFAAADIMPRSRVRALEQEARATKLALEVMTTEYATLRAELRAAVRLIELQGKSR